MSYITSPFDRCRALLFLTLGSLGCAEDLQLDQAEAPSATVSTDSDGENAFSTRIDASDETTWVYFSFASRAQVIPVDAANSVEWDLGFQRFHIISNGGASGSGGASVAILTDTFDAVLTAPSEGYLPDQPDSDDSDTIANSVFEDGDGWYAYDEATNRLSPRGNVYVVRTARGAHYKLALLDYYDEAGSSGHPSFSWAELAGSAAVE
jgi:heme-binding HmuY-like protein